MATTPFDHNAPPTPFFNIYNDGSLLNLNPPSMPTGPCNFADLNNAASGAKCGCRRFWARSALGAGPDQAEWCMCSHHACFHDDVRDRSTPVPGAENPCPGQENEKPKSGRDPLSPVQEESLYMPSISGAMDLPTLDIPSSIAPEIRMGDSIRRKEDTVSDSERELSMPDTLSWGNFLQSQPGTATLPPVPSQCLMGSQATSVASSSVQRYLRPFAGKGLNTLSGVPRAREPLQDREPSGTATSADGPIPEILHNPQESVRGSQPPQTTNCDRHPLQPVEGVTRDSFKRISETVTCHNQRLDRLENVSFSAAGHEECVEKNDSMDLRVTELEVRVDEVERTLNDNNGHAGNRNVDESASVASVSTAGTMNTVHETEHIEMYSQIQHLRAQVSQLAALSPSFGAPWEIEVVFLPFALKGIWLGTSEFTTKRQSGPPADLHTDQWTQLPSSYSAPAMPFQSPRFQDWAPQDPDSHWLLPRACAPDRLIDRRLRSRGLIRKIAVKGPDARSINLAISNTFGTLFSDSDSLHSSQSQSSTHPDPRLDKYLGLHEAWVPLRKMHKDSRLRFLTPAEMVTSAVWDVRFLSSSVTMKATSIHRLYVTQPGAYLQDDDAYRSGWTWQKIREMCRYHPDSQDSNHNTVVEDEDEDYWQWSKPLDEAPTPASSQSLSLRQSHHDQQIAQTSSSPTPEVFYTGKEFPVSVSNSRSTVYGGSNNNNNNNKNNNSSISAVARKSAPMRPAHIRTTSMPPIAPEKMIMSPAMRRRVASSGYERKPSSASSSRSSRSFSIATNLIPPRAIAISTAFKRRQQSRSPSIIIRPPPRGITPRWSTTSPSPVMEEEEEEAHKRGVTPFYYATPFSNAPYDNTARRGPSVGVSACGVGGYGNNNNNRYSHAYDDNEIGDDDGDDNNDDYDYEERGSATDPYDDTDMTHPDDVDESEWHGVQGGGDIGVGVQGGVGVRHGIAQQGVVVGSGTIRRRGGGVGGVGGGGGRHPEDEPWPGLPDHPMSDNENVDPLSAEDADDDDDGDGGGNVSDASSQPSEYPSTQSAWRGNGGGPGSGGGGGAGAGAGAGAGDFRIHEDDEGMDMMSR